MPISDQTTFIEMLKDAAEVNDQGYSKRELSTLRGITKALELSFTQTIQLLRVGAGSSTVHVDIYAAWEGWNEIPGDTAV